MSTEIGLLETLVRGLEESSKAIVVLRKDVSTLKQTVAMLQRRLEENGTLCGGAVACSTFTIRHE